MVAYYLITCKNDFDFPKYFYIFWLLVLVEFTLSTQMLDSIFFAGGGGGGYFLRGIFSSGDFFQGDFFLGGLFPPGDFFLGGFFPATGPDWLLTQEYPKQDDEEVVVVQELAVEINLINPVPPVIDLTRYSKFVKAEVVML